MPRKPKPRIVPSTWYCVIRISDLSTVYHGQDRAAACALLNTGTVLAMGDTFGAAERLAAMEAGKRKTQAATKGKLLHSDAPGQ